MIARQTVQVCLGRRPLAGNGGRAALWPGVSGVLREIQQCRRSVLA